jgi:hypothetical protein
MSDYVPNIFEALKELKRIGLIDVIKTDQGLRVRILNRERFAGLTPDQKKILARWICESASGRRRDDDTPELTDEQKEIARRLGPQWG